jgi:hypothetical protein
MDYIIDSACRVFVGGAALGALYLAGIVMVAVASVLVEWIRR